MWLHPIVWVQLSCVRHSSKTRIRLILLHKLGTIGIIGALVSDCSLCLAIFVGLVYGVCMMGCVDYTGVIGIVGCDGRVDWVCGCDWNEVVESDCSNSIISDSWLIICGVWICCKSSYTGSDWIKVVKGNFSKSIIFDSWLIMFA